MASTVPTVSVTNNNLREARAIIADFLNTTDRDVDPKVLSCLRMINSLISSSASSTPDPALACIAEDPKTGEKVRINTRTSSSYNVLWSTVTSATGLPQVEPEPHRSRSSSFWKNVPSPVESEINGGSVYQSEDKIQVVYKRKIINFDLRALKTDITLSLLNSWDFSVFKLAENRNETMLCEVAYKMFHDTELFSIFRINKLKFFSYFTALGGGYLKIPYHNIMHATDVIQACYYMTINHSPSCDIDVEALKRAEAELELSTLDEQEELSTNAMPTLIPSKTYKNLCEALLPLEQMALYTAAAMHDFDHPGRTNAFLVATRDPKAILYNDRSVLENHHAASAWKLLMQHEHCFIDSLDEAEYKRFRYLVIECILATDLAHHIDIINQFKTKMTYSSPNWHDPDDRFMSMKMIIKLADVGSPMRNKELHRKWTGLIVEEFYQQGDDEKARQLPVSNFMDRTNSCIPLLQDRFISNLVAPLADALEDASLVPISPGATKSQLQQNMISNHQEWQSELAKVKRKDSNSTRDTSATRVCQKTPNSSGAVPQKSTEATI